MLPRKTIEAYLFFLLRHRLLVSLVVAIAKSDPFRKRRGEGEQR